MIPDFVRVIVGLGLLTLGRRLFWLFVAAIGFVFGIIITERFLPPRTEPVALIIALVIGVVAALLAVFLQKLAIYVGGFLAGGSILVNLLAILGIRTGPGADFFVIVIFIIGGVIGAILVMFVFDWALIILSSLAGAALIVRVVLPNAPTIEVIVFVGLVILGIVIQAIGMRGKSE